MKFLSVSILVVLAFSTVTCGNPQECETEKPVEHQLDEFGLTLYFAGDQEPKEFLAATPCVAGVWWKCREETEEYFIGELHYPTENTADYDAGASQYCMVMEIKIRKQDEMPIDLAEYRSSLVLRDPAPDTPLSVRGDGTIYELVGFEEPKAEGEQAATELKETGDPGFLFQRNAELKYTPPTKDQ